jgi:hypothetical protein
VDIKSREGDVDLNTFETRSDAGFAALRESFEKRHRQHYDGHIKSRPGAITSIVIDFAQSASS